MNRDLGFTIAVGSLLFFLLCSFVIAFTLLYIKKRRQHALEKKELEQRFAQTLLQSQLEIKQQTLQHIAHELHDNIGQVASLIKINLNTLPQDLPVEALEKLEMTRELIRQLIMDVKQLSVNLNSDRIRRLGLVKCLETEVDRLNRSGQLSAEFQSDSVPDLPEDRVVILFRMVQEVLNNTLRHSQASKLSLSLHTEENWLILSILDNGIGFHLEDRMLSGGSGLLNLRHRAALIQGDLNIESVPGLGTKINIKLPLDHGEH